MDNAITTLVGEDLEGGGAKWNGTLNEANRFFIEFLSVLAEI